jgi:ribulose 1,5-bisphosphate synthetase/thiazole synthase
MNMVEDSIVKEAREIAPGLAIMELAEVNGPDRMVPTFISM